MFRFALMLLLSLITTAGVAAAEATARRADAPNIIFILTDDLGWGDLGLFHQNDSTHDQTHQTPQLDRLGAAGLQMRAHYCPAPVCAPSRASLFTGMHQGNALIRDNQFDYALEDGPTIGRVLQSAGYRTMLVGKYGLQGGPKKRNEDGDPGVWPAYPTRRGFDEFFGYVSHRAGHLHYPDDAWPLADKNHSGTVNLWSSRVEGGTETHEEVSEQLGGCYTTDLFTAKAKQLIAEHVQADDADNAQPFFLMLCYDTPHAALQVPSMPYPDGGGLNGGVQWTGMGSSAGAINTAGGTPDSFIHPDYADRGWAKLDARFATMVRRIDSAVGDLDRTLADLGIAENTLVVFTSDNGPHHESYVDGDGWGQGAYRPTAFQSYGPYDGTKRDVYEGGIRMPTLAWMPGTVRQGIDEQPSQFHDWLATFADLAGVAAPLRSDGVSLVPTLTGQGESQPRTVYIEYFQKSKTPGYDDFLPGRRGHQRGQMQVLFKDGIKGLRTGIQSADDPLELFDVTADPSEANDLAGERAELAAAMQRDMIRLHGPIEGAKRPYDDAAIPADETGERRAAGSVALSEAGNTGTITFRPSTGDDGPAKAPSIKTFALKLDAPARCRLTVEGDIPFVARLHRPEGSGAILVDGELGFDAERGESGELGERGVSRSVERRFAAGTHSIDIATRRSGQLTMRWQHLGE